MAKIHTRIHKVFSLGICECNNQMKVVAKIHTLVQCGSSTVSTAKGIIKTRSESFGSLVSVWERHRGRRSRAEISSGRRALVPTGLVIKLPSSVYVKILPRLGYSFRNLNVIPGIVHPENLCRSRF